ncbi:tRNA-queuosine alpha-mannosyltransferase domain-containing protein [Humisphaera borealis]|uniref:tRNA-queuosine alpha-mannosyltransferase n=1 Tax=Humisphaera borealis TaxID=2807512 RepID=A0A7M2X1U5_9BACT|nr:DUF3524 domain-containing protein [Humisphaera borealis]QOV91673.1 DUF3524 domain-containing protein [Humisphaera borealis]
MARQLDILALEPFFGGVRRAMLEAVVRYSRHRWTVLKLPPRRIERRLAAAANWFSEQLSRHWVGRLDLVFTSEAMNLASLMQLMPNLVGYPSVVYFHDNQLPDSSTGVPGANPIDLVNFNTCQAATEIWFNSAYHRQMFQILARAMADKLPELSSHDPIPQIREKIRLFLPPVDLSHVHEVESSPTVPVRQPRNVFVETRDANVPLLNALIDRLRRRKIPMHLITVGPVDKLDPLASRTTVSEYDDLAQIYGMFSSSIVLSVKPAAPSDYQVIRAMAAGCRPMLPEGGVYPELLPTAMHKACLYPVDPDALADRLALALGPNAPAFDPSSCKPALKPFDAITQCRLIDERIEQIVARHSTSG